MVRWIYTFAAVNVLWLLFRSESIAQWLAMLYKIITFQSTAVSDGIIQAFILPETQFLLDILHLNGLNEIIRGFSMTVFLLLGFGICLIPDNNYRTQNRIGTVNAAFASLAFVWGFMCLTSESVFVYFNF